MLRRCLRLATASYSNRVAQYQPSHVANTRRPALSPVTTGKRFYSEKKVYQRTKPHCNVGEYPRASSSSSD